MLISKLLKRRKPERRQRHDLSVPARTELEGNSSPLKIVHAGGIIECYYMAVPAKTIMDKYPSFILTRPDFFRRPWDSFVRPSQVLVVGEKFFLVPRHTVKKLRWKVRKVTAGSSVISGTVSFASRSINDVSNDGRDASYRKICLKKGRHEHRDGSECDISSRESFMKSGGKKHVRFMGLDEKPNKGPSSGEKKVNVGDDDNDGKLGFRGQSKERKKKAIRSAIWQPSLVAITERHGAKEC